MRSDPPLPEVGWRVEICPTKKPHCTDTGMIAVPLWIVRNGQHYADVDLIMSPLEGELLNAAVARILDDGVTIRHITTQVARYRREGIPVQFAGEA